VLIRKTCGLSVGKLDLHGEGDASGDLVLHRKYIVEVPIEVSDRTWAQKVFREGLALFR
jgi:hypothetical protein